MYYCSSCGQAGDGRFCRMCGTALSSFADQSGTVQLAAVAATQVIAPVPGPEFDGLFRSADSVRGPSEQTRLLPAPGAGSGGGAPGGLGVSADYRMAAPGLGTLPAYAPTTALAAQYPPLTADGYPPPPDGYDQGWEPEDGAGHQGPRKGVIYGALAAVAAVAVIIGALLYLGTPNAAGTSNGTGTLSSTPAGSGQSSQGALVLPSADVTTPPTTAAPAPPPPTAAPTTAPPPAGDSALPLSLGSTGNLVKYVQQKLDQLHFYNGPDNGRFDQATAAAVVRFQASATVQGDPAGVVGRSTMTALVAAGSQPDLRLAAFNNPGDTKRLQAALDYAEDADLQADGVFSLSTRSAVMRYQSAVGLAPTGQVDTQTWNKLQSGVLAG